jgi:hypothetical protein
MRTSGSPGYYDGNQDFDEPLWFHATEVGTPIRAESTLWVQYNSSMRPAVKYRPMPKSATAFTMPFDRKKCQIRQCVPGVKRLFFVRGGNVVMAEKRADVGGVRPQSRIFGRNAESVSHSLRLPVRHSRECGDTRDAATGNFFLHDWRHICAVWRIRASSIEYVLKLQYLSKTRQSARAEVSLSSIAMR